MKQPILFSLMLLFSMETLGAIESLDKIIVVVNDDAITQHELDNTTDGYKQKLKLNNLSKEDQNSLEKQVLQKMIRP